MLYIMSVITIIRESVRINIYNAALIALVLLTSIPLISFHVDDSGN